MATLIDITEDGKPIYVEPHNIAAADSIGVDELWPINSVTAFTGWPTGSTGRNLSGAGVSVGMWEADFAAGSAGVRTGHGQFGGRVTLINSTGPSPHATAVAGTIGAGGIDAFASIGSPPITFNIGNHSRGMAYAANIRSASLQDFSAEFNLEASDGLRLSNHSYGQTAGWASSGSTWIWHGSGSALQDWKFGAYMGVGGGVAPRELDMGCVNAPFCLMVYSAGNDADDGPGQAVTYYLPGNPTPQTAARDWDDGDAGRYDSLPPSACAKNVLTVGAAFDLIDGHTAAAANITLAPFSSFGPTDDGRIKPDVVACGDRTGGGNRNPLGFLGVLSPFHEPTDPNNDYYTIADGTSFSAPSVSGALALVLQRRNQLQPGWGAPTFAWPIRSSTQRGLAIHAARESGPNAGPDFRFGYGLFDAVAAVNLMGADAGAAESPAGNGPKPYVKEILLPETKFIQFKVRATGSTTPLRATICWTDPQGTQQSLNSVDEQTKRLVNDLDLRIYPPGTTVFDPAAGSTFKPWVLNPDLAGQSATTRATAATTGDDNANNVEQVVVNNPTTGADYIVRVTHKGGSLSGDQQWVSIILSGNNVLAVPTFAVSASNQGGGYVLITWNAVPGAIYRIQGAPTVFGPWSDATGDISANLEPMATLVLAPSSPYFWRGGRWY